VLFELGTLVWSTVAKVGRLIVAILLASAFGLIAAPSSATAAVPDPLFIQNALTKGCLDQHYAAGPTTTVYAWPECHYQGNQQWGFMPVRGNPYRVRVVNHRGGWCLSQPNPGFTRVFAEMCVDPVPNKQIWTASPTPWGYNLLVNAFTGACMGVFPGNEVFGTLCPTDASSIDPRTEWHWQPQPW
jgi:hypothetical protein